MTTAVLLILVGGVVLGFAVYASPIAAIAAGVAAVVVLYGLAGVDVGDES